MVGPIHPKKRDHIISAVNKRVKITRTKYGIRVPKNRCKAHAIDQENGDNAWSDAIKKEMQNIAPAFKLKAEDERIGNRYKYVGFHMVYNIKMDFTQKVRLVAGGHQVPNPAVSTNSGVVSRESICIALTYAALMELDIMVADIGNAYLQAPTRGKHCTKLGPEFGPEYESWLTFVVRAAHGLKKTGADFQNHSQGDWKRLK